jgi:RNA recognition motif-containing protein
MFPSPFRSWNGDIIFTLESPGAPVWGFSRLFEREIEKLMNTKLYVGNLSYDTTEEGLRTLFAQAGAVEAVDMIKDRDSGRPKGFAFVTMSSQVEAEKAISMFNEKNFDDRDLKVNIARPREERPRRGGYGDRRY